MFLAGVTHNDLHLGNIFLITYKNPKYIRYYINNELYTINSQYEIKIYDFDRSYVKNYEYDEKTHPYIFYKNEKHNIESIDFIKVLCNFVPYINNTVIDKVIKFKDRQANFKSMIISLFFSGLIKEKNDPDRFYNDLLNFYEENRCNLRINLEKLVNINSYDDLIKEYGKMYESKDTNKKRDDQTYILNKNFFNDGNIDVNKITKEYILYERQVSVKQPEDNPIVNQKDTHDENIDDNSLSSLILSNPLSNDVFVTAKSYYKHNLRQKRYRLH